MIELPAFDLLKRQPDPPHVANVVVRKVIPNEHGAQIVFTVRESRNGREWWISAALGGLRMSNTLHTSVRAKADEWIRAVKTGNVRVRD